MKLFRNIVIGLFAMSSVAVMPSCKSGSQGGSGDAVDLKMNFKDGDKYWELYTSWDKIIKFKGCLKIKHPLIIY